MKNIISQIRKQAGQNTVALHDFWQVSRVLTSCFFSTTDPVQNPQPQARHHPHMVPTHRSQDNEPAPEVEGIHKLLQIAREVHNTQTRIQQLTADTCRSDAMFCSDAQQSECKGDILPCCSVCVIIVVILIAGMDSCASFDLHTKLEAMSAKQCTFEVTCACT